MIHNMLTSAFIFESKHSPLIVQEEQGVYYIVNNELNRVQDTETEILGGISTSQDSQ